ncbi:phosphatidylinositol N-acetylglucosaminyltransferase subunit P [Microdochium nivale]|nr:phosphatidylinositol N-acetylglucosaminyltransferase subunit P [Microdochium nivale]
MAPPITILSDDDPDVLSDILLSSSADSSSGEDDEDMPRPLPLPHQNYFAPPFYGRPPTPLPPSPSLTSLLRPSRPNTPEASDDEIEPVPRASPQVPTYEYYGFVLYLFSSLVFLVYLLWSYLPSPFLHALGIYYYPNRWWSLAIPSFLVMLLVYIYVALAAYNTEILTLPMSSIETVVDEASKIAAIDFKGQLRPGGATAQTEWKPIPEDKARNMQWASIWNEGTDAVMDVPLAGVCEVLYANVSDDDDIFGDIES